MGKYSLDTTNEFHLYFAEYISELIGELESEINHKSWLGKLFRQDKVKERKIIALTAAGNALRDCHSLPVIQAMLKEICQDKDITYSWLGTSRSFKLFDWALKNVGDAIS